MSKSHNPKDDFYDSPFTKSWLIRLTPLFILKYINLLSYKYDPFIYKIEKRLEFISTFYYKVTYPIRNFYRTHFQGFFRRIKRSFSYIKLGWYSNDWDYTSIFELLTFKLNRMEKVIRNGYHLNSEDVADQIKIVRELLDKMSEISDHEYLIELEDKFPNLKYNSIFDDRNEKRHVQLTENGAKKVYYEFTPSNLKELTEEEQELISKERNRLRSYYSELKISNLRVIFHILTPSFGSYKNKIELKNQEIMEKENITWENYYDNLDKLRYTHNGVYNWWD